MSGSISCTVQNDHNNKKKYVITLTFVCSEDMICILKRGVLICISWRIVISSVNCLFLQDIDSHHLVEISMKS